MLDGTFCKTTIGVDGPDRQILADTGVADIDELEFSIAQHDVLRIVIAVQKRVAVWDGIDKGAKFVDLFGREMLGKRVDPVQILLLAVGQANVGTRLDGMELLEQLGAFTRDLWDSGRVGVDDLLGGVAHGLHALAHLLVGLSRCPRRHVAEAVAARVEPQRRAHGVGH
ncbi:MAG: hypothetical protein Q4A07_12615, partial [Coriobacteriales bacterium]|nr:hypothetical protein [Coriobacteriales bacterium]